MPASHETWLLSRSMASTWKSVENAPDRKYYRLTAKGKNALDAERRQWLDVNAIFVKLWGPQPGLSFT